MDEISNPKKRAFLAAYRTIGMVRKASEAAEIACQSHYNWLKEEGPDGDLYRRVFAEAHDEAIATMEDEAIRRAVHGVDKPVYQGKELVGHVREYSDVLLIFLLKGARPEKYRERYQVDSNIKTDSTAPVKVEIQGDWYGNANRLSAAGVAAPTAGLTLASPSEAGGLRPAVGQDGNGSNGNGHGTRP